MDNNKLKKIDIKDYFLDLIQNNPEVRSAIISVVKQADDSSEKLTAPQPKIDRNKKELKDKQSEIDELESRCSKLKKQNKDLKDNIEILSKEYKRISEEFSRERDRLEQQKLRFEHEERISKSKILNLQDELTKRKQDYSEVQDKLIEIHQRYSEVQNKLTVFEQRYSELDQIYSRFCSLDEDILRSYNPIINNSSPLSFLVTGAEKDHIYLFYDKICMEGQRYKPDVLRTLNKVFDFLFEQFCISNPEYRRIDTQNGEVFDAEKHTRTSDSPPVGKIKRVIISGYTNESGTKKYKSFVEIG